MDWMNYVVAGNELWRLLLFFMVMLLSMAVGRLARFSVERIAARPALGGRPWQPVLLKAVARPFVLLGFAVGIRLGASVLILDAALQGFPVELGEPAGSLVHKSSAER